jgi:hypothetical protein
VKEAAIQQPLLSNGFANKRVRTATVGNSNREKCFLYGPCRDFICRTVSESQLVESRQLKQ